MKLSKRLEAIASYIDDSDKIVDVGCDHAYLDIYVALNKKNKLIIASDVSPKVISNANNNINKYKVKEKIKTYCTNGLKNIDDDYDTVIIAGMGSSTIINILKDLNYNKVNKIIISSNNNWEDIRTYVTSINYFLNIEKLVLDSNKLYSIMVFDKNKNNISKKELLIGKYNNLNNKEYKVYYDNVLSIYKKIPLTKIKRKYKYYRILSYLKSYLRKEDR